MNVPISANDILDIFEPGGLPSIAGVERAIRVIELIAAAKSIAIDLLEQKVEDQNVRIQELLEHNNQLLERARKAEGQKTITVSLETAEMIKAVRQEIDARLRPRHVGGPL
jgi:hypothetical protein